MPERNLILIRPSKNCLKKLLFTFKPMILNASKPGKWFAQYQENTSRSFTIDLTSLSRSLENLFIIPSFLKLLRNLRQKVWLKKTQQLLKKVWKLRKKRSKIKNKRRNKRKKRRRRSQRNRRRKRNKRRKI